MESRWDNLSWDLESSEVDQESGAIRRWVLVIARYRCECSLSSSTRKLCMPGLLLFELQEFLLHHMDDLLILHALGSFFCVEFGGNCKQRQLFPVFRLLLRALSDPLTHLTTKRVCSVL